MGLELVDGLLILSQLFKMGLELVDGLLILSQASELLFQTALHPHTDGSNSVHLSLDPRPHLVGLLGKLPSQGFIVLLLLQFILESLVSLWNQGLHLVPL